MYCLIGLISIYVAFKDLKDKENKNSVGSFVFWFDLGVMFVLGKWLPALADGILLIILVLPPILKKVSPGNEPEPTLEKYLFQLYVLVCSHYLQLSSQRFHH